MNMTRYFNSADTLCCQDCCICSIEAAVTARSALNGVEVHGAKIIVNYAKEKVGQFAVGPSCSYKTSQPTKANSGASSGNRGRQKQNEFKHQSVQRPLHARNRAA